MRLAQTQAVHTGQEEGRGLEVRCQVVLSLGGDEEPERREMYLKGGVEGVAVKVVTQLASRHCCQDRL